MKHLLLAGLGGFIGSSARYLAAAGLAPVFAHWRFPLPTFAVNISGCFAIGLLGGMAARGQIVSEDVRVFVFTGILGGFTTFSTFAGEGLSLVRKGEAPVAAAYVLASVLCGLMAAWAGWRIAGPPGPP